MFSKEEGGLRRFRLALVSLWLVAACAVFLAQVQDVINTRYSYALYGVLLGLVPAMLNVRNSDAGLELDCIFLQNLAEFWAWLGKMSSSRTVSTEAKHSSGQSAERCLAQYWCCDHPHHWHDSSHLSTTAAGENLRCEAETRFGNNTIVGSYDWYCFRIFHWNLLSWIWHCGCCREMQNVLSWVDAVTCTVLTLVAALAVKMNFRKSAYIRHAVWAICGSWLQLVLILSLLHLPLQYQTLVRSTTCIS